jgi:hypothetical protein
VFDPEAPLQITGKELHITLTPFLEKNTSLFMKVGMILVMLVAHTPVHKSRTYDAVLHDVVMQCRMHEHLLVFSHVHKHHLQQC